MLQDLLPVLRVPCVLDADALNIIAAQKNLLYAIPAGSILTPHPKEFERLACGSKGNSFDCLMKAREMKTGPKQEEAKVFLAQLGQMAKRKSMKLFEEFRDAKIPVAESFSKDSLKAQLRSANKIGAKWVMIFGQKEALEDFITLRDMDTGVQEEIKLDKVVEVMKEKIKSLKK